MHVSANVRKATVERLDQDMFDMVVQPGPPELPISIPGADGKQGSSLILRPKKPASSTVTSPTKPGNFITDEYEGMIFVDRSRTESLFNTAVKEHCATECQNLNMSMCQFRKWGVCLSAAVKCTNCQYVTKRYNLYHTIEPVDGEETRGARRGQPNMGLAIGLIDSTGGNEKQRLIQAASGMSPASRRGMQKVSNDAADLILSLNKKDLSERRDQLKKINEARGLGTDATISTEFDGVYGNAFFASKYTPGLGASYGAGLLCENMTKKKQVIAVSVQNKLCSTAAPRRKKGLPAVCPDHATCTANLRYSANISEEEMGKDCARQVSSQDLRISHVTTDGDARAMKGIQQAVKEVWPKHDDIVKYNDGMHLGQCQRRAVKANSKKFSKLMFGQISAKEREVAITALGNDIQDRCHQTHGLIYNLCKRDSEKVKHKMPAVIEGMLDCYSGVRDHTGCRNSKYVGALCHGKRNKLWCDRSDHLRLKGIKKLRMTVRDRMLLKNIIEMKLGSKALDSLEQRKTTQGCESRNSAIRANVIRSRRWPRLVEAKVHSAVHRCNNGPHKSTEAKLKQAGCRITRSTEKVLEEQQKRHTHTIEFKKRPANIARQRELRRQKRAGWYINKDRAVEGDDTEYRKHQYLQAEKDHTAAVTRSKVALKRVQIKSLKGNRNLTFTRDKFGRLYKGTQKIGTAEHFLKVKYHAARESFVKARQLKATEQSKRDAINRVARRLIATQSGEGLDHVYSRAKQI